MRICTIVFIIWIGSLFLFMNFSDRLFQYAVWEIDLHRPLDFSNPSTHSLSSIQTEIFEVNPTFWKANPRNHIIKKKWTSQTSIKDKYFSNTQKSEVDGFPTIHLVSTFNDWLIRKIWFFPSLALILGLAFYGIYKYNINRINELEKIRDVIREYTLTDY